MEVEFLIDCWLQKINFSPSDRTAEARNVPNHRTRPSNSLQSRHSGSTFKAKAFTTNVDKHEHRTAPNHNKRFSLIHRKSE
jgi:hypothetical protein